MNHNQTTANIFESSPRAADWEKIFHRLHDIPLRGPLPMPVHLPGIGVKQAYMLDLSAITLDERQRLVEHLAERFNLLPVQVEYDLDRVGVPILADEVLISVPPGLAFSMMPDFDDDDDGDDAELRFDEEDEMDDWEDEEDW